MTVSEQIRIAFMRHGASVSSVAATAGVSESTVRNILHGRRNVGVDNVCAVAAVVGIEKLEIPQHLTR